jgi:hypothetical protein
VSRVALPAKGSWTNTFLVCAHDRQGVEEDLAMARSESQGAEGLLLGVGAPPGSGVGTNPPAPPPVVVMPDLPIMAKRDLILRVINLSPITIIEGETGCESAPSPCPASAMQYDVMQRAWLGHQDRATRPLRPWGWVRGLSLPWGDKGSMDEKPVVSSLR